MSSSLFFCSSRRAAGHSSAVQQGLHTIAQNNTKHAKKSEDVSSGDLKSIFVLQKCVIAGNLTSLHIK
ncbi:hypothetical protein MALU111345_13800 [Marinicrinis lubricantis]